MFSYKHKYTMSKEIETCGEVDRGFGKVLCLLYLLEKENLMKIRKYLLCPSRYDYG